MGDGRVKLGNWVSEKGLADQSKHSCVSLLMGVLVQELEFLLKKGKSSRERNSSDRQQAVR